MDGRKTVGGKLEVKLRMRNPLVSKQVEEVKEKWLIIDVFERNLHSMVIRAYTPDSLRISTFNFWEDLMLLPPTCIF